MLKNTSILQQFSLSNIQITKEISEALSEGIHENHTLSFFQINSCEFKEILHFEQLSNSLSLHNTLETIEFSNCNLTDQFSNGIKKIINGHSTRRNESTWISGLRSDETIKSKGLLELILSNNNFTDVFASELIPILSFDQYLRVFFIGIYYKKRHLI